jgi:calcineurin-like phosphoesterase
VLSLRAAGREVRVVVLADRLALDDAPPIGRMTLAPYAALRDLPPSGADATIVEMHALSVTEKQGLAYACDGEVAAVLGTHTHEPTLALRILPGGTALVTDVGMTGPDDGPQGMHPTAVVERVRGEALAGGSPVGPAEGEIVLGAVVLEIAGGHTRGLRRL